MLPEQLSLLLRCELDEKNLCGTNDAPPLLGYVSSDHSRR